MFAGALLVALCFGTFGCQREREQLLNDFKTSERPEIRARALARLGEIDQEDDFPLFLKAARESSALVRESAAEALGSCGDTRAIDTLGELLADPDGDVQAKAAAGLARFDSDKARSYLLNAYDRQDAPARKAIATAVGIPALGDAVRHEAKTLWERNIKALESGGPAERVGAAEEIGRSGRGEAVERLLPRLGDDSVLLAAAAARGLGAAKDKRALEPLVRILKEDYPALREAAADALGSLGDAAAVPALEKMALEGGPSAQAAVRALGRLSAHAEALDALCKLTGEGSLDVAVAAARLARERQACPAQPVLGRLARGGAESKAALAVLPYLAGSEGAEKLVALLDSPDSDLKLAALDALAEVPAPQAEPKLLKMLTTEAEKLGRARQKWVTAGLPVDSEGAEGHGDEHGEAGSLGAELGPSDHEKAGKLRQMLEKVDALKAAQAQARGVKLVEREPRQPIDIAEDLAKGEDGLLVALVRAAGGQKIAAAAALVAPMAKDPLASLRAAACEALGALVTEQSQGSVAGCLEDRSTPVVKATLRGLARAAPEVGGKVLLAGLQGRSSDRSDIIRALGELKAREAAPKIAELLGAGGLESVEAAVAIGKLGDRAYTQPLIKQLGDRTNPARMEIVEALGELGDPSAAPALQQELFSERPEIRAAAARALGRVGARDGSSPLSALRFDYYAAVRRAVEEVLGPEGGAH